MSEESRAAELGIPPRLTNPLSGVARKTRVYLLGTSAIGVTIVFTGLIPTEIRTLGVRFAEADRKSLLVIFAFVVAYFLIAFGAYALSDYVEWESARRDLDRRKRLSEMRVQRINIENYLETARLAKMDPSEAKSELSALDPTNLVSEEQARRALERLDQEEQVLEALAGAPFGLAGPVITLRFIVDCIAPLLVGIFAISALLIRAL